MIRKKHITKKTICIFRVYLMNTYFAGASLIISQFHGCIYHILTLCKALNEIFRTVAHTWSTHKLGRFPLKPFLHKLSCKFIESIGKWNRRQFREVLLPITDVSKFITKKVYKKSFKKCLRAFLWESQVGERLLVVDLTWLALTRLTQKCV